MSKARDLADIASDDVIATTTSGVDVTGTITADGLTVDGSADVNGDLEVGAGGTGTKLLKINGSGSSTSVMDIEMQGGGTGNPTTILRHTSSTKDFSLLTGNNGSESTRLSVTESGSISFYEDTGTTPKFYWDASAESLGIGTASPSELLELSANTGAAIKITSTDTTIVAGETIGSIKFESNDSSGTPPHTSGQIDVIAEDEFGRGAMAFSTGRNLDFQEAMRIDSSGNLLVGTTDSNPVANNITSGVQFGDGRIRASRADRAVLELNRKTSDGTIAEFRKDGTTVGSIGVGGSSTYFGRGSTGLGFAPFSETNSSIFPYNTTTNTTRDNAIDLGFLSARFDDIYATNGTIQTSDANEKQQIAALTDAEMTAAKAISQLFKTFKWNDSVAEKGADAARTHSGVIAQEVEQAMADAGLDAGDYAFFISATWWETQTEVPAVEAVAEALDEDGNVITEAVEAQEAYTRTDTYDTLEEAPEGATERNRKGIRYPQLLSFVGAATEQRLASIEARLTALEG